MKYSEALDLMHEYVKVESLRRHMYAVEAIMRGYARSLNENEEQWAIAGVLHDFDYERFPTLTDHPFRGAEILTARNVDHEIIEAILGHANHTNVARNTTLAKYLFASDEIAGFINACAILRPSKILDLEASSVMKKLKDKAFARNVSREEIYQGVEELGIDLRDHISFAINAMKNGAERLNLLP